MGDEEVVADDHLGIRVLGRGFQLVVQLESGVQRNIMELGGGVTGTVLSVATR